MTTRLKLSRREAVSALIAAYNHQKPRDGVAYPDYAVRMPAARWEEVIDTLRPLALSEKGEAC
ncbi:MAG: hypothetical protein EPO20_21740 [Betaproteobacteria bacterium]|nr:MAG: hypothetical protein EPO20_21740 [Betaproteobacteria bacterium]